MSSTWEAPAAGVAWRGVAWRSITSRLDSASDAIGPPSRDVPDRRLVARRLSAAFCCASTRNTRRGSARSSRTTTRRCRRCERGGGASGRRHGRAVNQVLAQDAKPPLALIRVMNPIMRRLLSTPAGRLIRPFALLEFDGHRSGRRYRVPVGWHRVDGKPVVFTPAPWRENFRGGRAATIWYRGRRIDTTATLDDDPDRVAAALQSLAQVRGSLRAVGVRPVPGRPITAADAAAVDRALIRFDAG